jgi:hypothetical protein
MADDGGEEKAKKLANEIRGSAESSEFDLAGYGAEQCDRLAAAAFGKPLPLKEMVRLSFLVGGGKKVRQKYNDGLPALWAEALKKAGFNEDRGASLDASCAGTFKYQHNTDTDLKVTHVYPRIDPQAASVAGEASEEALSPAELLTFSEMPTFQRMIASKTPSLAQKRRALEVLKQARAGLTCAPRRVYARRAHARRTHACRPAISTRALLSRLASRRGVRSDIEAKLAALQPLTDDEQHRYDTLDAEALEEKQRWLSKQLEAMVDGGQLTAAEKDAVVAQLAGKLEQLEAQVASAEAEGKAKRVEKLQGMLAELRVKCAATRELKPIKRPVKFEAEIRAVQKKLAELEKLEGSKVVLPLAEVQKLAAKPKLLADLQAMQAESQGWFSEAAAVSLS